MDTPDELKAALRRILDACGRARTCRDGKPELRYLSAIHTIERIAWEALYGEMDVTGQQRRISTEL